MQKETKSESDSNDSQKVKDPLAITLKLSLKDWILYWKTKYEHSHLAHVEQRRAAKTILDQRDAAVRMLNELPQHRILELQDQAEATAKKAGKPFVRPKKMSDISKAQRKNKSKPRKK